MPTDRSGQWSSIWVQKPGSRAGTRPGLTRERIVQAAIEVLDRDGLDGLSMRKLGAALESGATSLYWHVGSKDGLLELVGDAVMADVHVPAPDDAGWRASAAEYARGIRAMVRAHPWVIGLLGAYPAVGPRAIAVSDRTLAVLEAAGLHGVLLAHASRLLTSFAIGSAVQDAAMAQPVQPSRPAPSDDQGSGLADYLDLATRDYPRFARFLAANGAADPDRLQEDGFEFGLARILDGLQAMGRVDG